MRSIFAAIALILSSSFAHAQSGSPVPVTVDNFSRANPTCTWRRPSKDGGFGKFAHNRTPTEIDKQTVIRMNRDTLYSWGTFDLDAGPVTVTLPNSGKRFMSAQVINQDHYVPIPVAYAPRKVTISKDKAGTRYVMVGVRTLVNPTEPNDLKEVHALQDAITVQQKAQGKFEIPNWDEKSQTKVRDALLVLASTADGFKNAFGAKGQVDSIHHLLATAAGWGGNPDKDAAYASFTPVKNDGNTVYKLRVKNVPVEAFWSISVYNDKGFFEPNKYNAYSLNDLTAKKNADGSVDVQFGGCDGKILNCLPITKGWNYTVRMYRPRPEILSGKWKFPEAQPASSS